MFGWLKGSGLPRPEMIDWLEETWSWLAAELDDGAAPPRRLVLPTEEFYAVDRSLEDDELAFRLFEETRRHAGLADWPVDLVPQEEVADPRFGAGAALGGTHTHGAAGTFRLKRRGRGNIAEITFAPSAVRQPATFIATMAHELGHYVMSVFSSMPPGGEDAIEPATDLCAVYLGFGVFQANGAFSFNQFNDGRTQGWSSSRLGYLDEKALSYGLALFLRQQRLPFDAAAKHLKSNPRSYTKDALKRLAAVNAN